MSDLTPVDYELARTHGALIVRVQCGLRVWGGYVAAISLWNGEILKRGAFDQVTTGLDALRIKYTVQGEARNTLKIVQRATLHADRRRRSLGALRYVLIIDGVACASGERESMIALLEEA